MISDLLNIIDKLIKLKQYKNKKDKQVYIEFIEPLFNELSIVHSDYIKIFSDLYNQSPFLWEKDFPDYIEKLTKVVKTIQKSRLELEPARNKIKAMTFSIEKLELIPESERFVESMMNYLFDTISFGKDVNTSEITGDQKYLSLSTNVIDKLQRYIDARNNGMENLSEISDEIDVKEFIDSILKQQRNSWNDVCESFAQVKLKVALEF